MDKIYITKDKLAEEIAKAANPKTFNEFGPIAKILATITIIATLTLFIPMFIVWLLMGLIYVPLAKLDNWFINHNKRKNNG